MYSSFYKEMIDVPEPRERFIRLVGTGASAPTAAAGTGAGVTITYVGVGDYKIKYTENPGTYLGIKGFTLESATGTDLKNFSVVFKDFDATNKVVEVLIFSGAGAATDLTTAQSLSLTVLFKQTAVNAV